ncbi:1-phosphatidylinositol-3-phosphate 5-kinase FAB1B [Striga hermonthica]|uniref:Phosphatidylinositol 3-phosphate 5-kinase type III n=1 Tax=Striga hermonthica TaxID=68872 RepID=A0A9N7RHC0_STRHE|nr:1-phosphatidylinositol-3-phosphate 5-kinase FAB1B [Striga hermonthica]
MDEKDRTLSDLVGLFKSWIPWRSEPAHVSRDFWMPDQSCRVCYECDTQFTLFNRRHHCRVCGRIFCAKCTSNWVPTESGEHKALVEEWDKIRACNYCFKQWGKDLTVAVDNGIQVTSPDISCLSPSETSYLSTKSSGTCSSSVTFFSMPQSAGLSPRRSPIMETAVERERVGATNDRVGDVGEQNMSVDRFEFSRNRSDDDDEDFSFSHVGSQASHFAQVNDYYGHAQFHDLNSDFDSRKVHPDGDAIDSNIMSATPSPIPFDSQNSDEVSQIVRKGADHDIVDECGAPSSLYVAEDVNTEPVDFESNGVLWLPPEPEDEEDEREALLFEDDDDDGDGAGEWGYLRNSSSFGSGEFRSRDRSNEEHKKVMKNVVEGHFRALVAQLLQVENLLPEAVNDKESWLEIITALSWEAATLLKPDTSQGGQMDPGGYVKVKCLASGLRSESSVVKGIVCKKNVAHRRMTSKIEKPRLLILGGALEYQRISNALSSFDTLLQQETDHLKMAVAKIDAHNPDILLVEKSVSRYAQEYLLAKDISLVLNIKKPLLERIARCTGAQIVPSIDHLSSQKLGYCDMFHVEKFQEEHGSACQAGKRLVKTLMFFEGCPKPLGFTILLRGASGDELKKVKHVVQYGVFAAYHLALETSFLADEGASLPEFPLNSPINVALPEKASLIDRSISVVSGFMAPAGEKLPGPQSVGEPLRTSSVPTSDSMKATITPVQGNECLEASNLRAPMRPHPSLVSSTVQDFPHSTLTEGFSRDASEDRGFADLSLSSEPQVFEKDTGAATGSCYVSGDFGTSDTKIMQSDHRQIDSSSSVTDPSSLQPDGKQIREEQPASKEEFPPSPSDHRSILVSLSSRCVWKGTVCERSHLFRIKYYGNFDKPLGRFLRDHLFDQNYVCRSCEMPAEAHVQCYTHRQGTLTISVKKLPEIILPGEKDGKIWMWHRCLRCPRANGFPPATRRIVMSDAAWGLSFGKFLELSFSNHAAASRVASCGHSLHRDCLRFYGSGKMVACFRYASIDVHSVYLPPHKLDFSYESQEWIERELNEVVGRAELLFSEVLNALRLLVERKSAQGMVSSGTNFSESKRLISDLEGMLQKEKSEFEETLEKILKKEVKKGQPAIDVLELNRLRRQLVFQSYMWDQRLIHAASQDVKNQPNVMEVTPSESTVKLLDGILKVPDISSPIKTRLGNLENSGVDAKTNQNPDHGASLTLNNEIEDRKPDVILSPTLQNLSPAAPACEMKPTDESDPLVSGVNVRRAFSDGQDSICLSQTLDSAWTGQSHTGTAIPKNKSFSESVEVDTLSTLRLSNKLEVEDHIEDLSLPKAPPQSPSVSSAKSSENLEDTVSWLSMPFVSFYRSINKNFVGPAEKLNTLGEYNPMYISSFRDSELQGGARLLLPVGVNETVIPVYDDEPTSIISYALVSPDYFAQLSDEQPDRVKDSSDSTFSSQHFDVGSFPSFNSLDEMMLESYRSLGSGDESMLTSLTSSRSSLPMDPLSYTKALHARVSFSDEGPHGKAKVLSINISCCDRCPEKLKQKLLKMPGVDSISINVEKNLVFVEGPVDPMTLLNKVARFGKPVQLLPNDNYRSNNNNNNNNNRRHGRDCFADPTGPHPDETRRRAKDRGEEETGQNEPHKCEAYEPPKVDERVCRDFFCKIHPRSRSMVDKVSGHNSLYGGLPFFGFGGSHPNDGSMYHDPQGFGYNQPPMYGYARPPSRVQHPFSF